MKETTIETVHSTYQVIGGEKGLETTFDKVLTTMRVESSAEGFGKIETADRADSWWAPSDDIHRQVLRYTVRGNPPVLYVTRNNKWNSNMGVTVRPTDVELAFEVVIRAQQHRKQASLILVDGTVLTGFVLNKNTNLGLYFPKIYWPMEAPLPSKGERLPLRVAELIIG